MPVAPKPAPAAPKPAAPKSTATKAAAPRNPPRATQLEGKARAQTRIGSPDAPVASRAAQTVQMQPGFGVLDDETAEAARRAGAGLRPSRAIGGSLSALVRQTMLFRKGVERGAKVAEGGMSDAQRQLADRTARAWRRAEINALDFEPTRVMCGNEVALEADAEQNQWVLYAFMAGVRKIVPKPAMTASDVLRFVQELVMLEPSVRSISQFRDWIDADGAEGFDVRVHTSFREVIEEIDIEDEREFGKAMAMARFEAPRSTDAVYIASRDLDLVAMRKEFELPIEAYVAEAAAVGGMSDEELAAIGQRCDDANAWTTAEIEAVLAIPELRTAITPEQMARRVVTRLSSEADQRFLMLLTKLNSKKDPFRQAVAEALGTAEVGEVIARQLALDSDAHVEALGQFLVLSPPGVSQAVMSGLFDRATDQEAAKNAVISLAEWYGAAQICEWVQPQMLNEESAAILGGAIGGVASAPAELSRIVSGASPEVALVLLEALPQAKLSELASPVRLLWTRAKAEMTEQVVELMVKTRSADNLKLLGDLMLEGKADKWRGRTLYALCAGLVERGMGRSHVLSLALERKANEQLRLIALDCLQRDAELVAEATRFRLGTWFDSAAIKARVKELGQAKDKKP